MTKLEALAVELHDHMWSNLGVNDDWPLQVGGDDEEITRLIELLNELQDEITKTATITSNIVEGSLSSFFPAIGDLTELCLQLFT